MAAMRVVLAGVLLVAVLGGSVHAGEDDSPAHSGPLAAALARIAKAGEQEALRLFWAETGEGVAWNADPKASAEVAAAVWGRCTTSSGRSALVRAIASRSLASAIPTLRAALRDRDSQVVNAALDALVSLDLRHEVSDIVALTSRPDAAVRARAAWALGMFRAHVGAPSLLALRRDPDADVRARVAFALGRMNTPEHADVLAAMLADPAPGPRGEAAVALGRLGAHRHADAVARLLQATDDGERWRAARALGELGARAHVPALAGLLEHGDPWTRGFAAWSLGLLDARDHAPALGRLLEDETAWVRVYAVQALGRLDARALAPALVARLLDMASCSLLRYEDPERLHFGPAVVAEAAMEVLQRWELDLTDEVTRIARGLHASDDELRSAGIEALAMLGARDQAAAVAACLRDPAWAVRRDALWALAVLGATQHADVVAQALTDPEPTIRAQALWALGVLRSRPHREPVQAFADDATLGCCVAASTSPLPSRCIGRQSTLADFAREALKRMGPE